MVRVVALKLTVEQIGEDEKVNFCETKQMYFENLDTILRGEDCLYAMYIVLTCSQCVHHMSVTCLLHVKNSRCSQPGISQPEDDYDIHQHI